MVSKWLRRTAIRRTLFASVVVLLTAAVGSLGWRVLAQDRQLANQQIGEVRKVAADLVVVALSQRLASIEHAVDAVLSRGQAERDLDRHGGVLLHMTGDSLRTWPSGALLYYPQLTPRSTTPEAEALAHRAVAALKAGNSAAALAAYARLEQFGAVPIGDVVGGIPAALFAHLGRLTLSERQGDETGRLSAARALDGQLRSGQWPVSEATYHFLDDEVLHRVLPDRPNVDERRAVAEALTWLSDQWTSDSLVPASGRTARVFASGPALVVWRRSSDAVAAWIGNRRSLSDVWSPALNAITEPRHARVAISTADGQPIVGSVSTEDRPEVRLASATTLPWTIQVTSTPDDETGVDRRRLLVGGITMLFVLIVAGAWLVERTIARELAVADLQSDFVSAVSHEFRTPLTTLCQLSEMLMRDRVASEDDRRQYYQLLHGESHRLRRLVETLLNFGRLEAGRMEFRFDQVDVSALVRNTVDEFSASRQARSHRIELSVEEPAISIGADGEVLKTVLWNLLENAAKYSPDCDTIWVTLSRHQSVIALKVRDRGVGIPARECRQVFEKFVRGAGARASGVGGVGVGLAMARRIVEAHDGRITLESKPGVGSTFTVVLPVGNSQVRADLPASAPGASAGSRRSLGEGGKVGPYDVEKAHDVEVAG